MAADMNLGRCKQQSTKNLPEILFYVFCGKSSWSHIMYSILYDLSYCTGIWIEDGLRGWQAHFQSSMSGTVLWDAPDNYCTTSNLTYITVLCGFVSYGGGAPEPTEASRPQSAATRSCSAPRRDGDTKTGWADFNRMGFNWFLDSRNRISLICCWNWFIKVSKSMVVEGLYDLLYYSGHVMSKVGMCCWNAGFWQYWNHSVDTEAIYLIKLPRIHIG